MLWFVLGFAIQFAVKAVVLVPVNLFLRRKLRVQVTATVMAQPMAATVVIFILWAFRKAQVRADAHWPEPAAEVAVIGPAAC